MPTPNEKLKLIPISLVEVPSSKEWEKAVQSRDGIPLVRVTTSLHKPSTGVAQLLRIGLTEPVNKIVRIRKEITPDGNVIPFDRVETSVPVAHLETYGATDAQKYAWTLLDRILAGDYPPGSKLPSIRELHEQTGLDTSTIQVALQFLSPIVQGKKGSGRFIPEGPILQDDLSTTLKNIIDGSTKHSLRKPFETAASLLALLGTEGYLAGKKLPSIKNLATRFGVSIGVAQEAIQILAQKNLLRVQRGSGVINEKGGGTFVTNYLPDQQEITAMRQDLLRSRNEIQEPLDLEHIATSTIESITARLPNSHEVEIFALKKPVPLLEHRVVYFNDKQMPIALKVKNIPTDRAYIQQRRVLDDI
jgi:DNA-binding GntR family transcriptional regulator